MTSTSHRLQKKVPDNIVNILRLVTAATAKLGIKTFVIGATARDLIFENVYSADITRKTEDIDFGIAVASWGEYAQLKTELISGRNFKDDRDQRRGVAERA